MADTVFNPFSPDVESSPVDLNDLVTTVPLPDNTPPIAAIRNKAATTAMLTGQPDAAVDNYQAMMQEGQQGGDQIYSRLNQQAQAGTRDQDLSSVYTMLSNPKVDETTKQNIITNFSKSNFLKDSGAALQSKTLAAPSAGESADSEVARISVANELSKMYNVRGTIQGLVNKAVAEFPDRTILGATGDAAEQYLPFNNNIITGKIQGALNPNRSILDVFRTFITPGTTQKQIADKMDTLDPDQKIEFAKQVIAAVKANSGMFGNDNQATAYDYMNQLLNNDYSRLDEFGTNAVAALDIIGLGQSGKQLASIGSKLVAPFEKRALPPRIEPSFPTQPGVTGSPSSGLAKSAPDVGVPQIPNPDITSLQARRASLLGQAGNAPLAGDTKIADEIAQANQARAGAPSVEELTKQFQSNGMNAREAKTAAQKEFDSAEAAHQANIDRLQNQAGERAAGSQAQQQIDEIDKQLAHINKTHPTIPAPKTGIASAMDNIYANAAVSRINHASPGEIAMHVNPGQSRLIYDTATGSASEEASQAFYGVGRDQATLNAKAPQAALPTDAVITRVADIDELARKNFRPDDKLVGVLYNQGGDEFTGVERAGIKANVVNDFENATGLRMVEGMGGEAVSHDGATLHVSAVYESPTGSWSKPEDALEQAKYALRKYGIQDDEIQILKKDGMVHTPVDINEFRGVEGDYKVRVNTKHLQNPTDIREWEQFDVKRNWLDRFGQTMSEGRGSINDSLVEAAGKLHPTFTGSAVNADYQATKLDKILLEKLKPVGDNYTKLSQTEKAGLRDYWDEANFREIDFDPVDMKSRGFSPNAITATRHWRDFWDHHYYLENLDKVRGLQRQGYEVLENANDKFFAKRVPENTAKGLYSNVNSKGISRSTFYDPTQQAVRGFDNGELDALYQSGGHLAELVRPVDINGQRVTHIISRQSPTEYMRGVRDFDRVLNYKKGYYQVTYKSPKFIDKVELNSAGHVIDRKTVAVSGDTPTAELFRKRMSAGSTDSYVVRGDIRAQTDGFNERWDLDSSQGRISQRYRGKLLEDASAPNQLGSNTFVQDPIRSAISASHSVSNRLINGPVLEAAKERFVQQYGHLIAPNPQHAVRFPNSLGEIGAVGEFTTSELADARTSYNKIRSLENGYINTIDQTTKAFFNLIGDELGSHGFGGLEKAARAVGEKSPVQASKRVASDLFIAMNPLRQVVIQGWQATRLVGYNPMGTFNTVNMVYDFLSHKVSPNLGTGSNKFIAFAEESGLLDSVDRHTLVASSLSDIANTNSRFARVGKMLYSPVELARKVGFDAGEYSNRLLHLGSVYDRYERLGRNLADRNVRAQAYSEASALMGDMTRAGEMPLTSSSMGAAYQFMSAPHKMILQPINRRLDIGTRMRMLMSDAMLFGVAPVGAIAGWFGIDKLTNGNTDLANALDYGLVGAVLNHFAQTIAPGSARIDTSGLDPRGLEGLKTMVQNFWSGGFEKALAGSAAGSVLTGNKLHDALLNTGRFFNVVDEPDDNNPTTFLSMINEWASLTSGWSNARKALMIIQTQKRADAYGKELDGYATTPQAIAQAFGFGSETQSKIFQMSQELSNNKKAQEDDVQKSLQDIERYYQNKLGTDQTDPRFITGVTGWALKTYENQPWAQELIAKQLKFSFQSNGDALTHQILQACEMPNPGAIHDLITRAPNISDENKQQLHTICQQFQDAVSKEK